MRLIFPVCTAIASDAYRLTGFVVLAALLCASGSAAQYATVPPTAPPVVSSACLLGLSKVAEFQQLPPIVGPDECGAPDAVLLQSVILPDQTKVVVAAGGVVPRQPVAQHRGLVCQERDDRP